MDSLFSEEAPTQASVTQLVIRQANALASRTTHTSASAEHAFGRLSVHLVSVYWFAPSFTGTHFTRLLCASSTPRFRIARCASRSRNCRWPTGGAPTTSPRSGAWNLGPRWKVFWWKKAKTGTYSRMRQKARSATCACAWAIPFPAKCRSTPTLRFNLRNPVSSAFMSIPRKFLDLTATPKEKEKARPAPTSRLKYRPRALAPRLKHPPRALVPRFQNLPRAPAPCLNQLRGNQHAAHRACSQKGSIGHRRANHPLHL